VLDEICLTYTRSFPNIKEVLKVNNRSFDKKKSMNLYVFKRDEKSNREGIEKVKERYTLNAL
jgi:predicted lipoprotein with Yx(FWY)xxD motif